MLPQCFIGEGIELAGLNILFELAIPGGPVKHEEPVPELRQFLRRQPLDLVLNSLDFAHNTSLALTFNRRITPILLIYVSE